FVLHQSDTRDMALVLSNGTADAIDLPTGLAVTGLVGGTLTFAAHTCGPTLAGGASCSAVGTLVASATVQTTFDVSLGAASVRLSMTALPACPATCGIFGTTNCCASSVVPGNAPGAMLEGQTFYRDHDNAADGTYASKAATASISDFRLDTYEVTAGRFRAFLNAGMGTTSTAPGQGAGAHAKIPGSGWDPTWSVNLEDNNTNIKLHLKCDSPDLHGQTWTDAAGTASDESRPITCTNWYEAMAFCIWDGGYLPTEAEWNYAASGGHEQRAYPWSPSGSPGSTTIDCTYANYKINSPSGTFCVNGTTGGTNRVGSES